MAFNSISMIALNRCKIADSSCFLIKACVLIDVFTVVMLVVNSGRPHTATEPRPQDSTMSLFRPARNDTLSPNPVSYA